MNILTIDLENWYPSEYYTPPKYNDAPTLRHLHETLKLLKETKNSATFFILGELAARHPEIIENVFNNDHEVAYHSHHHDVVWQTPPEAFNEGLQKFIELTRDRIGEQPTGFRAPLFSLRPRQSWIFHSLERAGFKYDSSIFPSRTPLYGYPTAPIIPYHPNYDDPAKTGDTRLWELPLNTLPLGPLRIPTAGGFYTRILPTFLLRYSLQRNHLRSRPSILYFHPRELDQQLPQVPLNKRQHFMLYFNLQKTKPTLTKLLNEFRFESARNLLRKLPN